MFENLTNKFEEIFSSLKKAPSLDEKQVDEGLRNIRQALLEADVSLSVAKEFVKNIKPKALGQEIIRSTSPGQMVVKIVHDELVKLLGESNSEINLNAVPPVPIMLVGLQGSGKTTTTAKLAKFLEKNKKKKIMMVSLDVYRPAAQEQLKKLGEQNNMKFRPLHDRVLIEVLDSEEKTSGGIIIPDTAKEKPQEGKVVAIGSGARTEDGKIIPMDVKVGDLVLFGKWSGTEVKIDGKEYSIMKESDIMGISKGKK